MTPYVISKGHSEATTVHEPGKGQAKGRRVAENEGAEQVGLAKRKDSPRQYCVGVFAHMQGKKTVVLVWLN